MSILSTFKDWLPHPVYLFCGGPFDGERKAVPLSETHRGMMPLPFYQIQEMVTHKLPVSEGSISARTSYRVYTYKFIPTTHFNEGYYEYVDPGPRDDSPVEG